MRLRVIRSLFALVAVLTSHSTSVEIDENGYIVYCPCMGRFGNQADHFLGALRFASGLNRTLVVPPWIEYSPDKPGGSIRVPFEHYFELEPLKSFHRVISMESFMSDLAPLIWPPDRHVVLCWGSRGGSESNSCNAKEGNPFGPFWDHFNVSFSRSEFYGPLNLHYNILRDQNMALGWHRSFSPGKFPVLAFVGAPAEFPVQEQNRKLQKFMKWSPEIANAAERFIEDTLPEGPFIGIHLRNDLDWPSVCQHVHDSKQLFASAQCLGYRNEHGLLTMELCEPSQKTILKQVRSAVRNYNAKSVFVASDRNHMIDELNAALKDLNASAYRPSDNMPHVSLAILGRADYFIGNCVSSFSAFVAREREINGLPTGFWAFKAKTDPKESKTSGPKQDL